MNADLSSNGGTVIIPGSLRLLPWPEEWLVNQGLSPLQPLHAPVAWRTALGSHASACGNTRSLECMMKVRPSTKKMCEKCRIIRRHGRVWVICPNPRHKQRQG